MSKFVRQIETVQQRTQKLSESASLEPSLQSDLLVQAFEELQIALEELKVAEEELREQNEQLVCAHHLIEQERQRYLDLFNFAPDCYLVTDIDGKILEANCAAAKLFQVPQNYLKNKVLINFVPEQYRRSFRTQLTKLRQIDHLQEWEIQLQKRDGNYFDAAISVTTVNIASSSFKWRWLVRDITARKQAEAQIRTIESENSYLQETARLKSQFMAMVSHELRTPMHAILGFAQLLMRQPYHLLSPQLKNMVERIICNAKNLLTLIEDILDFSTLEAGRLDLKLQEFNLAELVQAVTEELSSLTLQKNLSLNFQVELPNPLITNDRNRLRQILVNIISNAIKFTYTGSVSVEVQALPENRIAMIVRDTGIGIAKADLQNIFQEFQQVNQSFNRRHGGTGLGLAIVDKLVRLMQGSISVESQLGDGSTFRVEIPVRVLRQ